MYKRQGQKRAARGSLEIQDAKKSPKIAISAPSHRFVGPFLRNEGMYRQSEKNLLCSNTSSTCPDNMVNFGLLTAEICWRVWGTPANFNGFRVLASFLHRRRSTDVNQTLHDVWPSAGAGTLSYIHFRGLLSRNEFASCKFQFASKSCVLLYWQY